MATRGFTSSSAVAERLNDDDHHYMAADRPDQLDTIQRHSFDRRKTRCALGVRTPKTEVVP